MRDPGRPIPVWDFVKSAEKNDVPMPRCFLTGPHFDNAPPAYPHNAIVLTDPEQTRQAVNRFVDQGASAIKIYYRFPLDLIQVACATAQQRGVPVTAHLELVRADQAIKAGLNGVEHITSFGSSLAEPEVASRFVAAVQADNAARRPGRPELWATLDLDHSPRVKPLIDLIIANGVVVSPTLFVMEVREGDRRATEESLRGFQNMMKFVGICHRAGAPIVVGSHGEPPNAYCRELELLVDCGLTPMEAILAGTKNGAEFLGAQDRLGAVAPGRLADLILVDGDPLVNISAMRQVRRVMLNGLWVNP
jgi:imidazolonepropionase-like amidohydrolase